MFKTKLYDVIVIGAGPAGSTAATSLALKGLSVAVLEKEKFPRYAVGESLIPHFWKIADTLGVSSDIENANFIRKSGGIVNWGSKLKAVRFGQLGHKRPGLHIERDEFDQILINKSKDVGAELIEKANVKRVQFRNEAYEVEFDLENLRSQIIRGKFVVDASGQSALLNKQFKTYKFDASHRFQAFWGYFDRSYYLNASSNVTLFEKRKEVPPMSFISGTGEWGWVWNLVLKEQVSVGIVVPRDALEKFKSGGISLEEKYLYWLNDKPIISEMLSGANLISQVRTIRDYAYFPSTLAIDRCFIIGDAASFADPINSGGVTVAMYGGMLASWAIINSLKNQNREEFYREYFVRQMKKRLAVFQLLSYPKEKIIEELKSPSIEYFKNQSIDETSIALAHLMITNRGEDFDLLMKNSGISFRKGWFETEIVGYFN